MAHPDWRRWVVYQVYPRSFMDSDGDGVGDLRGIVERLDHVAGLGVDAIWLSPVYRSPGDDNGYDISDYEDVDPTFGTLDDLDDLIAGAHERGLRLVMDLVVNHTSDEHAWFEASRSSREDPHRDWYVWRDARPGGVPGEPGSEPNDWVSNFSGSAWEWDERTGQYYLHLFSRKQPDLNWECPQLRQAVYAMMRRWLDRGVDGFRMDVINFIAKDPAMPFAVDPGSAPAGAVGAGSGGLAQAGLADGSRHYTDLERVHEHLQEMRREVFDGRPERVLTVGEMPGVAEATAARYTDPARGELDMVFQFEHVNLDHGTSKYDIVEHPLSALKDCLRRWQDALWEVGWNSLYWSNHDQPRVVSRMGDMLHREASAKALATMLHCHRGTPYVYQGEEIAMGNHPFRDIGDFRDIEALRFHARALAEGWDPDALLAAMRRMSRDNARTPMQWDASETAGFTTGHPWIDVNPDRAWVNVAEQTGRPGSVLEHYRALVALRHEEEVLTEGTFELLEPDREDSWVVRRALPGAVLVAAASFVPRRVGFVCPDDARDARVVLDSHGEAGGTLGELESLQPWQSVVAVART